ncbi:MAG: lysostaphin resistance A-like protein [bacterium]
MDKIDRTQSESASSYKTGSGAFFIDLALYLSVMFLIREVYFPDIGFIANGLLWSFTTLVIATWRMKVRGITWAELGLCKPKNYKTAVIATISILVLAIASIVVFQMIKEQLHLGVAPDTSDKSAVDKFGNLKDNWLLFFSIIPFIWLESFLEEILDRGFLINWIERMFSSTFLATILAVILQAVIFGFRHSYDLSERSITVGLIGLAMGIGYVAFGRNLWPLIVAHCLLNTFSMLDRVV